MRNAAKVLIVLAWSAPLMAYCAFAYGLGALVSWLSPLSHDPLQVEDDR